MRVRRDRTIYGLTMTAAFAEEGEGETTVTPNLDPVPVSFTKLWTNAIPVGEKLTFPVEFISNSITGDDSLPEPAVEGEAVMPTSLTLELTADGHANGVYTVPFTVNLPKEYGVYIYKITETDPQIENTTPDSGAIFVAVMYTNEDGLVVTLINDPSEDNTDTAGLEVTDKAVDTDIDTDNKNDQFQNQYDIGSFQVSKSITGNASTATDKFVIKVTFTSSVDLDMVNVTFQENGDEVIITEMTANTPIEKTFEIGDGETLHFDGIPQGVVVTVVETNQVDYKDLNYYVATYEQTAYDADGNEVVTNPENGAVFTIGTDACEVAITNTKETEIPTGVELDSIPYIVLLAVAALGAVAFVVKRRMAAADED